MSLEKKFLRLEDNTTFYWNGYWDQRMTDDEVLPHAKKCVQICDEFAVGFAEWKDKNYKFYHKNNVYTKLHALSMNPEVFTLTELLEIYKQGL